LGYPESFYFNRDQGEQREAWIKAREAELLPVPYYHVVFTLPDSINPLCLYAPDKVYNLLFKTAWSVMQSFAADPKHLGARSGMIAILHIPIRCAIGRART